MFTQVRKYALPEVWYKNPVTTSPASHASHLEGNKVSQDILDKPVVAKKPLLNWSQVIPGLIIGAVMYLLGYGLATYSLTSEEPSMPVTLYVTSIDEGADLAQYKIEQVGDQLIYEMPQHVLNNLQLTPDFIDCVDGLAISSIVTNANAGMSCDAPAIHVVLLSPR